MILGGGFKEVSLPRRVGVYSQVDNILNNNIMYIAGLVSLTAWYHHVRPLFVHDFFSRELVLGMQENLAACIDERIKRLKIFKEKLGRSKKILLAGTKGKETSAICSHDTAIKKLEKAEDLFHQNLYSEKLTREGASFVRAIERVIKDKGQHYITVIKSLESQTALAGSSWLQCIEENITSPLLIRK